MKVKTISRTKSFGNYENISMSADVGDNDTIDTVVKALDTLMQSQIDMIEANRNEYYRKSLTASELEADINSKKSELDALVARVDKYKAFCQKHGISIPDINELPF
jgi:hypothetical protein